MGVKSSLCETISIVETKNIRRELNSSTEAIKLPTAEIDIFLNSRANPIPKPVPMGSTRYPKSFFLSIFA